MPALIPCHGWWQQLACGRQPMRDLRLQFADGQITGSGYDIIGPFTFTGTLNNQGQVAMTKRYLGRHTVNYLGQYDGEGLLWGHWHIGPLTDRWLIKIAREISFHAAEVHTIVHATGNPER